MKKIRMFDMMLAFVAAFVIFCSPIIFCGCTGDNIYTGQLLRLHIRAHSNGDADQAVKLEVRDRINAYIADNIDKTTFAEVYAELGLRLSRLAAIADGTLKEHGFYYGARAKLCEEYFPSRRYGDTVVPEGTYDALVIELGSGSGDNWWCVIYPPLCYGERFEYRSFFADLFSGNL